MVGTIETTQEECESNGCCWNPNDPYPACFYKNAHRPHDSLDQAFEDMFDGKHLDSTFEQRVALSDGGGPTLRAAVV